MRLLINIIRTTAACENLIINKPTLKFINTSLIIREEKVILPCLIVEEGGVELLGREEIFLQVSKIAKGSKLEESYYLNI